MDGLPWTAPALPVRACRCGLQGLGLAALLMLGGCYAPMFSHGIPARELPDHFRAPIRSSGIPLNYANLTQQAPADYRLGAGDILEIGLPDVLREPGQPSRTIAHIIRVQVMANGHIQLPMLGPLNVGNMNVLEAQSAIVRAYRINKVSPDGTDWPISVYLAQKATHSVLVLGAVKTPGVHQLPKYENDIGHAIAAAGGFADDAEDRIEVHRRMPAPPQPPPAAPKPPGAHKPAMPAVRQAAAVMPAPPPAPEGGPSKMQRLAASLLADPKPERRALTGPTPTGAASRSAPIDTISPVPAPAHLPIAAPCHPAHQGPMMATSTIDGSMQMYTIPLRGHGGELPPEQVTLYSGDVIVVPSRRNEVFFVVGKLAPINFVRFTVQERERELGGGFLLPKDRDIDVVTAVAMAGYIDPIDSPTTVTVHRTMPDGRPLLILVDLIKARYDPRETVMVQAGDILYLNPDGAWYFRRQLDRIMPDLLLLPYQAAVFNRWIP